MIVTQRFIHIPVASRTITPQLELKGKHNHSTLNFLTIQKIHSLAYLHIDEGGFFSKIVINTLALISFICIAIFCHQYHLNNSMFEIEFIKELFTQHKDEKCLDNCDIENLSNYCDLPMPVHNFISVILWILCIFSTIEGILELFCNCMPYRRFYQKSDEIKQDSVSPNELESCL